MGWATDSIERAGLDTAVDQAADGIVITDKSGRIQFVNPAFTSMTGYSNIEALGQCPRILKSGWQSPAFYEELWGTIQSGKIWQGEVINRRKDGTIYNEEMRIAPVLDTHGEISGYIAIKRDITERMRAMQALAESEARFCRLFEESGAIMLLVDPLSRTIVSANGAASSYYGYSPECMVGMSLRQINILSHDDVALEKPRAVGEERHLFSSVNRLSSGEERSVDVHTGPIAVGGRPLLFYIVHDVTDRKRAQEALRASEERYRVAFQTSLDAISISRLNDGTYVEVNDAFVNTMGYERKEVLGRTALELDVWVDSGVRLSLVDLMRHQSSCRDVEAQFRRKNGEVFSGLLSVSLIGIDGSPCLLSALRDVSDSKVAEKEIKKLVFFDSLTGLPNRRLLLDELGKAPASSTRSGRKRALLFVDLDDFKTVNDTLGHKTGDLMLQEIALRLKACLRDGDTVARQGGDEFVVLLEGLSESSENATTQARAVAEKILAVVGQPFHLAAHECRITSCIGIAVFGNDRESPRDALQQADIAVHQAKLTGRNSMHCFAPAMQTALNARASMVQDLRVGINRKQFLLYYQPQVDRGHLVGVEALLRWKHPTRGIVPPNEFISLAEETGMILPLGNWVLETACKQIAGWATREETAHIAVSVNISAQQFRQPNFVEQILASLENAGANPKNLRLELTESILVKSIEDVIAKMSRLKDYGVRFSVDDFGTGYSSLTYLKRLPLDQLKIDRSFVQDILLDVSSGAIAQSIISLSKAMGFSMIAEGVETEQQRESLIRMGCNSFQGYLFSQPLPVEEFELLIASQHTWHAKYPSRSDESHCNPVLM